MGNSWGIGAPKKREGSCVNDPFNNPGTRCGVNAIVPPVGIPDEFLKPGENVIAVKVHNGQCCDNYFNLLLTQVRTRLVSDQ